MASPMVIADLTIWSQVLRGRGAGLQSLFTDLQQRGGVTAPGAMFAQLLTEAVDDRAAERIRGWAAEAPPIDEPPLAWVAAGDLWVHLQNHGVRVSLLDAYLVGLCLREQWSLWSYNPQFEAAARVTPLERYQPTGL